MLIYTFLEFIFSVLFHFLYDLFPSRIFAIIFPINESVFQHLKLFTYPILFTYLLFYRKKFNLSFIARSIYLSQFITLSLFYILKCGFNFESTLFDICLTFIALYLSNLISIRINKENHYISLLFILINIFILGIFTINPLSFPIFM